MKISANILLTGFLGLILAGCAAADSAETLRFNLIDTTGGNTGAVEIAVYGEFIE